MARQVLIALAPPFGAATTPEGLRPLRLPGAAGSLMLERHGTASSDSESVGRGPSPVALHGR